MFVIRNDQVAMFAEQRRLAFETSVVRQLQGVYSGDEPGLISDAALGSRVHLIVDRAMSHGIDEETDVTAFVEIAFEIGDDFDTDPENEWAAEILNAPMLNPHEKVVAMQNLLAEVDANDHPDADDHERGETPEAASGPDRRDGRR